VIIDQSNFVQYKWNLIDTDLLDYYHIKCTYTATWQKYAQHKASWVDLLLNVAWAIFGPPGIFKWEVLA